MNLSQYLEMAMNYSSPQSVLRIHTSFSSCSTLIYNLGRLILNFTFVTFEGEWYVLLYCMEFEFHSYVGKNCGIYVEVHFTN
jgi:hypothetical protein